MLSASWLTVTSSNPRGTPAMHARTTPLLVLPVATLRLQTSTSQVPHEPVRQLVGMVIPARSATCNPNFPESASNVWNLQLELRSADVSADESCENPVAERN